MSADFKRMMVAGTIAAVGVAVLGTLVARHVDAEFYHSVPWVIAGIHFLSFGAGIVGGGARLTRK